ncbi:MAG: hypothetical protein D6705_05540 [Deltaproteobacteria bacterium]|nr:MAG: hypothetical protein D6705_05540 [Deltaproteobacteria bacterium]
MLPFVELLGIALVPGLAASGLLYPRRRDLGFAERLLAAVVFSWAIATAIGLVLARNGKLLATPSLVALACTTVVLAVAAWLRGARPATFLPDLGSRPQRRAALVGGCIVVAAVGAHMLRQHLQPWRESLVAWYYMGDILEIVRNAAVPSTTIDHGKPMPYEVNKISWSIVLAQWMAISGIYNEPMRAMELAVLGTVAGVALGAWVFARVVFRSLGPATVATLLILTEPRMVWKVAGFRGESFGFILFFAIAWLSVRLFRKDRAADHLSLAVAVAVAATAHMVPAVVGIMWTVAVAIWAFVRHRRKALRVCARAVPAALLAGAMVLATWSAVGRDVLSGQAALAHRDRYEPYLGADPTRAFVALVMGDPVTPRVRRFKPEHPRRFYVPPAKVAHQLAGHARTEVPFWPHGREKAFVPFVVLLLWIFRRRSHPGRDLLVVLTILAAIFYLWGLWFSWRYHTWLPAAHPNRREFPYLRMLMALSIAAFFDVALCEARARLRSPWLRIAAPALLVLWALGKPAYAAYEMLKKPRSMRQIRRDGRDALAWIRTHTPKDALFLTDGTTDGIVEVLADRTSLLEGRAPYFQPLNLRYVLDTIRGAQGFFRNPNNWEYLRRRKIDYVITGSSSFASRPIRRYRWYRPPPYLDRIATFGNVRIYRVPDDLEERVARIEAEGGFDVTMPPRRPERNETAQPRTPEAEAAPPTDSAEASAADAGAPGDPEMDGEVAPDAGAFEADVDVASPAPREDDDATSPSRPSSISRPLADPPLPQ